MKKIIVIILAVMICFGLAACQKGESPEDTFVPEYKEITVMSFNIRTFGFEDAPHKFWDYRKEEVVSLVLRHNPDIIGFQEVKDMQYDYLKENLTEYDFYGINGIDYDPLAASLFGGANAVFYKKDRFELLNSRTRWLSETPEVCSNGWGDTSYRTLTELNLKDKLSRLSFTFFNTHLAITSPAKQNSAVLLADFASQTEGAFIMVGDFNVQKDTEEYKTIVDGVLSDSMELAPDSDSGGTFHSFNGKLDKPWPKPIDFIFLTEQYLDAQSYKIIRDHSDEGNYPSDHYPIKAVINYKESMK